MFMKKEYQVKDVIEMYGITRDTIKYYENHGLIKSHRKENGYRVFDELNVRKLKKILAFRELGMTVDEVLQHCNSNSIEERAEILTKVRLRTMEEIRELNRKLNKIRDLERNVSENRRYSSGFNAGDKLSLCVDCPYFDIQAKRSFTVVAALEMDYSREKGMQNIEDCYLLRDGTLEKSFCVNCGRKQNFPRHYRCRIPYENKEQVEELLYNVHCDLEMQGYKPCGKVYMMKKVVKKQGEDIIILDTLLPLAD